MSTIRELWKTSDRISLFVISLVTLLVLLLTGLVLADRSIRQSADQQALVDATTSAQIVAQEVELAGERLYELSLSSGHTGKAGSLQENTPVNDREHAIRAVWVLDTLGKAVLDSAWWAHEGASTSVSPEAIRRLAREIAVSRHLQLQGLRESRFNRKVKQNQALLGEPVVENGVLTSIAIALVDEEELLAPAANASVQGRSFLALLVDGDTVSRTPGAIGEGRGSGPVRVPLPGEPAWFIISGQTPRGNATRAAIWSIGSAALIVLLFGLVRERRQTARIAERSLELERLSAELLRANRMKSEFLANVSHELRTPLNAIVGFVDLLKDGGYGELSERQISPVERIATSAARLRKLVDQVLDIAKIAAGRLDVRMENVALRPFLLNVVSEIEPLVQEKELAVKISTSDEALKVRTDPTHLRQIVINLLANAVKYTPAGQIELRTRIDKLGPPPRSLAVTGQHPAMRPDQPAAWVAVDVVDSGIGIAAGDLERIFEEFEQVSPHGTQDPKNRGTGLGLAISRRLATLLGGDVSVDSTVGKGSTFTVWLPLRDVTATSSS